MNYNRIQYKCVLKNYGDFRTSGEEESWLNVLGADGWELIEVRKQLNGSYYIFKRILLINH